MKRVNNMWAMLGAAYAPIASSLATYKPGPSYSVGIPSGSSISASAAGSMYVQISAPTTYQWVGLGIGTAMAGATIFVMYADGNGNVTVGVRDGGQGHVEPVLDSALTSGLTLLEGSGIVGSNMVANIQCTTCKLDSSSSSTSSPWIAAWSIGSAIDSTSTSYTIPQHSPDNTRQFTFDLTSAVISSDSNPFLTSSSTSTSTASGSAASATSGSSGSNQGSVTVASGQVQAVYNYQKAHGIVMGVIVVLVFPIGALAMRVGGNMNVHRAIQMVALVGMLVGLGLGVKLALLMDYLYKSTGTTHTVFGTVLVALFLIQPVLGSLHHRNYLRYHTRTAVSHLHIWYGRAIMALAVVNGGLGLKLALHTGKVAIAYGVVVGIVALTYVAATVFKRKENGGTGGENERVNKVLRNGNGEEFGSEELQPVHAVPKH